MDAEYQGRLESGALAIGGMSEGIEVAAQLAVIGINPLKYLYTKDDFERNLLTKLANRMQHYQKIRDNNLAVAIANQIGRLFKQ